VATNSDKRLIANVDVKNSTHSVSLRYMELNVQFHSPTLLSQQNNRESVTLLSDQRRRRSIYVYMYVYMYIHKVQSDPDKAHPSLSTHDCVITEIPYLAEFRFTFTHDIPPQIAANEEWCYIGVDINFTDPNRVSDNKIIKPNNK
jgi:hypothetical protein